MKLALPRGCALTSLLKTADAGQPGWAWTGSSGARRGVMRCVGSSCSDAEVPCVHGEEQSVVCELSVGQACGSGRYQQLYLLGSTFITQVPD